METTTTGEWQRYNVYCLEMLQVRSLFFDKLKSIVLLGLHDDRGHQWLYRIYWFTARIHEHLVQYVYRVGEQGRVVWRNYKREKQNERCICVRIIRHTKLVCMGCLTIRKTKDGNENVLVITDSLYDICDGFSEQESIGISNCQDIVWTIYVTL